MFCGRLPIDKNKEHVLPRWIIEMTGEKNRKWSLGLNLANIKAGERVYSASSFVFPACAACNQKYSALEDRTKRNMQFLHNNMSMTAGQWDDLLDWFDKVRIGLFLGFKLLNKDFPTAKPSFYIDQRIGSKDRCLFVYKIPGENRRLNMIGTNDMVFFQLPTAFGLVVNNLFFLNLSSDFLLSCQMGFPFPGNVFTNRAGASFHNFSANYALEVPLLGCPIYEPSIAVYQAVLTAERSRPAEYSKLSLHDYVRTNLMPGNCTKSKIIVRLPSKAKFVEPDQIASSFNQIKTSQMTLQDHGQQVFEVRQWLHNNYGQPDDDPSRELFEVHSEYLSSQIRNDSKLCSAIRPKILL
jgi:hypothetical protein